MAKVEIKEAGLTGSLKDFGLAELLQILGQQQKTGILTILGEKQEAVQILFDKGFIVGTLFPGENGPETSLAKRLISGGLITPDNWKKVYEQHQEELISIEQVLLKNELIRREDLSAVLRLLIMETIYNLFKWPRGKFQFTAQEVYFEHTLIEPLNTEYLLLDVLRMIDEWPLLAKRLPSFNIIFQKVNPLATLDVLGGTPWEKRRSFQMEVIYELVNGVRTVNEIINLSFIGEFDTCKNLVDLMDVGLIEPIATGEREKKKRLIWGGYLQKGIVYLLCVGWALFLVNQIITNRSLSFPASPAEEKMKEITQTYVAAINKDRIMRAREVFVLEEDRLPQDLTELVKKRLLPPR